MRRSKPGAAYTADWPHVAHEVKRRAKHRCQRCNKADGPGYILTVHHLDLDPSNNRWWNIPALCQRCHLHIQNKVVMEQVWPFEHSDWFKPYVAGWLASVHGRPDDEQYVREHLEELLALEAEEVGDAAEKD